jgi:hypothetical protein
MGNTQPGDGPRYKGRGYIQIMGKNNYEYMNKELGLSGTDNDLVQHPEKVLDPQIAYRILAKILTTGFGGRVKLNDFITKDKTDYLNARISITGVSGRREEEFAEEAKRFETILRDALASSKRN